MSTSFVRELSRLPPLRVDYRTASKHTQIRQRIERCVRGLEPETRLPPLRELSALFGATPPTVWRAVRDLIGEGVLHTREKSGIFVSRPPAESEVSEDGAGLESDARTLTLSTGAVLPHQHRFWRETLDAFHREHRLIRFHATDAASRSSAQESYCDVMAEYLPRAGVSSVPEASLLDLETLMGGQATRPFPNQVLPARASRFVPFQMTVPCLFVNLRWAAENGVGRPAFRGFADQSAYVEACMERMSRCPTAPTARLNIHHPLVWMGRRALDIVELARATDVQAVSPDRARLERELETVLQVWTKVDAFGERSASRERPFVRGFMEGRAGIFFGFSYDIGTVEAGCLDFPWEVVPILAVDDRTPVMVQCLTVNARTSYPIECVRFIEHVVSPAGQQRLADCFQMPLDARRLTARADSVRGGFGPEWTALGDRLSPIYPADEAGDYVYRNILLDDVYRCVDGKSTVRAALENMIRHARTYLSHRRASIPVAASALQGGTP